MFYELFPHPVPACVVAAAPVLIYAATVVVLAEAFVAPCPSLFSDELVAVDDPAPFVAAALLPASVVLAVDAAVDPVPHEPELEIPVLVVALAAAAVAAVVLSAPFPER